MSEINNNKHLVANDKEEDKNGDEDIKLNGKNTASFRIRAFLFLNHHHCSFLYKRHSINDDRINN